MKKRILVTGGAGMVGSHAAEFYAKKGWNVVVLDNLMRSRLFGYDKKSVEYNWNYLKAYPSITRIKGDVRNAPDVVKALGKGVDAVIHTAGQPGVPSSVRDPLDDFSINAAGTLTVLECVRKKSPRAAFVYCSTNKIYGENVDKLPLKELKTRYAFKGSKGVDEAMSVDHCGHTPYGVSKYVGDLYVQEYAHMYRMRTAVFRMSCIYGTRQFGFEDQGWVAWFIIAALKKKKITIYGNGKQVRDLLYVEDLVRAFDKFIHTKKHHAVYNIGGGLENTASLREFLSLLEKELHIKPSVTFSRWRPSDQKVYISDITKVTRQLKWKPGVSVPEGIKRLTRWVKEQKKAF